MSEWLWKFLRWVLTGCLSWKLGTKYIDIWFSYHLWLAVVMTAIERWFLACKSISGHHKCPTRHYRTAFQVLGNLFAFATNCQVLCNHIMICNSPWQLVEEGKSFCTLKEWTSNLIKMLAKPAFWRTLDFFRTLRCRTFQNAGFASVFLSKGENVSARRPLTMVQKAPSPNCVGAFRNITRMGPTCRMEHGNRKVSGPTPVGGQSVGMPVGLVV